MKKMLFFLCLGLITLGLNAQKTQERADVPVGINEGRYGEDLLEDNPGFGSLSKDSVKETPNAIVRCEIDDRNSDTDEPKNFFCYVVEGAKDVWEFFSSDGNDDRKSYYGEYLK